MRRILLAAVLIAVAALASAETVIWTGEVHVEKWVTDDGSEFYGYWRGLFGKHAGRSAVRVRRPHLHRRPVLHHEHAAVPAPPAPSGGAHRASCCRPTAVWRGWSIWAAVRARRPRPELPRSGRGGVDTSGLDWQDGQVVSVQLVQAATPVPALPVAGAVLLVRQLGADARIAREFGCSKEHGEALRVGRRLDGVQPTVGRRQARGSGGVAEGAASSSTAAMSRWCARNHRFHTNHRCPSTYAVSSGSVFGVAKESVLSVA